MKYSGALTNAMPKISVLIPSYNHGKNYIEESDTEYPGSDLSGF